MSNLNVTKFEDLSFVKKNGHQAIVEFPSGYGASIIDDGYGSEQGFYEVALFKDDYIYYDHSAIPEISGHLTKLEVSQLLEKISIL